MSFLSHKVPRVRSAGGVGLRLSRRAVHHMARVAAAAVDASVIIAASFAAAVIYGALSHSLADLGRSLEAGLAATVLFLLMRSRTASYDIQQLCIVDAFGLLTKWLVSLALLVAIAFLLKVGSNYSRATILIFALVGFVGLFSTRTVFASLLRRLLESHAIKPTRVIVIGECGDMDPELGRLLAADPSLDVVSYLHIGEATSAGHAVDEALKLSTMGRIDEVLVSLPWSRFAEIERTVQGLRQQALPILLLPDPSSLALISKPIQLGAIPAFELKRAALSGSERSSKRILDAIVAASALLALAPVMLLAAVAIRLESRGPVFFKQRRTGFNNQEFWIYKFRSMRVMQDGEVIPQATKNDPRITIVGSFLRRTSIDELPQLFNVLHGEMSVVGPRPHAVSHDQEWTQVIAGYARRQNIKPGMTGLAQVSGCRGQVETADQIKERVRLDIAYIETWSLALDIKIMAKTALVLFFQKEAF